MPAPLLEPYRGHRPPQVDKIWVMVPFSRPEHLARVRQNFERQAFPGKRLLLAVNGPALAALPGLLNVPSYATTIESRDHQSHAKNTALAFIRKQGGGFFTTMDDDDWYGPHYLDELAGYAKSFDVVGKQWHFVSLGEDISDPPPQLLLCGRRYANKESSWLTGGTISGWAEDAALFPMLSSGEDVYWCDRMRQKGARIRALSIYHYLYRRSYAGARHTWKDSRETFLKTVRPHGALEFPLTDAGEINLEIVTAEKKPRACRLLGEEVFKAMDNG